MQRSLSWVSVSAGFHRPGLGEGGGGVSGIMIVREQSKSNPAEKYLSTFPLLLGSWDIRSEGDGQRRLGRGDISLDRDVLCAAVER